MHAALPVAGVPGGWWPSGSRSREASTPASRRWPPAPWSGTPWNRIADGSFVHCGARVLGGAKDVPVYIPIEVGSPPEDACASPPCKVAGFSVHDGWRSRFEVEPLGGRGRGSPDEGAGGGVRGVRGGLPLRPGVMAAGAGRWGGPTRPFARLQGKRNHFLALNGRPKQSAGQNDQDDSHHTSTTAWSPESNRQRNDDGNMTTMRDWKAQSSSFCSYKSVLWLRGECPLLPTAAPPPGSGAEVELTAGIRDARIDSGPWRSLDRLVAQGSFPATALRHDGASRRPLQGRPVQLTNRHHRLHHRLHLPGVKVAN